MPYDSNGNFSLNAGYLAVAGQVIQPSQHNPPLEDIAGAGLSNVLVRDGRAPMVGNLNMGTNKITNLLAGTTSSDAINKSQFDTALTTQSRGYIFGLTLINSPTDTVNDIDISEGAAAQDTTTPAVMRLATGLTKRLDAAWSVGTNQGGLDTGSVANAIYYVWLIQRSDTLATDVLFSLSSTAPTMPANYDRKAPIGSFARTAATNNAPRSYSQKEATSWVSYTAAFNGITASAQNARSRRVGSCLEVEAVFTTNTTSATIFDMSLGFNGISGNVVCDSYWSTRRPLLGSVIWSQGIASSLYIIGLGGAGVVNMSSQSAGRNGFAPVDGNFLTTGTTFGLRFSIPIDGWN